MQASCYIQTPAQALPRVFRGMAEAIASLQDAIAKAAVEAAKEEVGDEGANDGQALAEAEVETIVREADTQGALAVPRTKCSPCAQLPTEMLV